MINMNGIGNLNAEEQDDDDGYDFAFDGNDDIILMASGPSSAPYPPIESDTETNFDLEESDTDTISLTRGNLGFDFGNRHSRRYSGASSTVTRASGITHHENTNPIVGGERNNQDDTGLGDSLLDLETNEEGIPANLDDLDVVDGPVLNLNLSLLANVSTTGRENEDSSSSQSQQDIPEPAPVEIDLNTNAGPSRTQAWIDGNADNGSTSDVDGDVEDNADDDPNMLKYPIFINLCKQKLFDPKLTFGEIGRMYEIIADDKPIDRMISMLQSNNIPEALMEVISFVWSQEVNEKENQKLKKNCQRILLQALIYAFPKNFGEIDNLEKSIETLLMYNIFEDAAYFVEVDLCSELKSQSKKYFVYERVQGYINELIEVTLQCRRTIFEFNPRNIQQAIQVVNDEKNLYLSPEKQAKYAEELYQILRSLVSDRCHKFLKSRGFDILPSSEENASLMSQEVEEEEPQSENSEEMNNRYNNYSMSPYNSGSGNNSPQYGNLNNSQGGLNQRVSQDWFSNSPANSQSSHQGSSQSSLQTLSNGEPSGIVEESYNFGRASQDSIENQGYASSSPHNSQYSSGSQSQTVPRMSQSPRADSEPEMQRCDWASDIHFNLRQSSSDSEGSQGPSAPKRPRQNYYQR